MHAVFDREAEMIDVEFDHEAEMMDVEFDREAEMIDIEFDREAQMMDIEFDSENQLVTEFQRPSFIHSYLGPTNRERRRQTLSMTAKDGRC